LQVSLVFLLLILCISGVKYYTDSGYNDDIFNVKKRRTKSIISDISKVPPFIYKSAGIVRNDSNNSNDCVSLKKKLEYYERLLLEKELLIKMQEDEINFSQCDYKIFSRNFLYTCCFYICLYHHFIFSKDI
jgi:hypothetical protein